MYNVILFLNETGPIHCTEDDEMKTNFGRGTFKLKVQVEVTPDRDWEKSTSEGQSIGECIWLGLYECKETRIKNFEVWWLRQRRMSWLLDNILYLAKTK